MQEFTMFRDFLIVGLSGFIGAITRYGVYVWYGSRGLTTFPWATLTVNVTGCLLVGYLSVTISPNHRQLFLLGAVGFAGAFTTFSAFGLETVTLLRAGQAGLAFLNVGANLILGMAAVLAGRILG